MELEPKDKKTHLAKVFTWSREERVDWVAIVGSGLGMAGPVLLGAAFGNLALGLAMAVGSLLVGGVGAGRDRLAQVRALAAALVTAVAAATAAVLMAGHGWVSDALMTLLAGAAGLAAAMGRPVAPLAIRFILLMIITLAVADTVPARGGLLLLIAAGALWTCAVSLFLGALARLRGGAAAAPEQAPPPLTLKSAADALATCAQASRRLAICVAADALPCGGE